MYRLFLFSLMGATTATLAQESEDAFFSAHPATRAEVRMDTTAYSAARAGSALNEVKFRNVGPTIMSGRVTDIDVSPHDPTHFYVAYASGGLWKTVSNGSKFTPLFDNEAVMTIGDVAVRWADNDTLPDVIWVGTGEVNSSRSSYAGAGMYLSEDGGKTWTRKGLEETHHIGEVLLHPDDPNTVWVAAMGHLYSSNPERGVFKTTDGGETWTRTLFIDEDTGVVDMIADPRDPDVIYAAAWHRTRRAWNFVESGETSGIHKSTDGGETWTSVTDSTSGFPTGPGVGRIGLDISQSNPDIVYAVLDNYDRRPPDDDQKEEERLTKDSLRVMSTEAFIALDEEVVESFLRDNNFEDEHTGSSVQGRVRSGDLVPLDLVTYLEDANSLLFDTPVIGAEVYRSNDAGATWTKTHDSYLDAVFNSYGYYFGEVKVAPHDADLVYVLGVPLMRSDDGGSTWERIGGAGVHSDHQALWVSPNRPGHLLNGNDGGLNMSYDDGESWFKLNTPAVGQFYSVGVDMAEPYNVYGGLQDNGVWTGPSDYEAGTGWHGRGKYPYESIMGGDGMQVQVDWRTNDVVYTGLQFGNYFRLDRAEGGRTRITPTHVLGEQRLRWNWQSPIRLSRHNQDIVYFGSNKLHRSLDRGETWTAISDDLSRGGREGDVAYGTLTTISESPLQFGLIYVGTDDGKVHVTEDGGVTWQDLTGSLPEEMWVSRVEASHHSDSTVYLSLNGYRWDDFAPYLYRSEDRGQTWSPIGSDLPAEPINVVTEDPVNSNLLYVGTDNGLYASLDGGQSFMTLGDMPRVAVHDLVVHPRENELAIGTHGRSIFVGDVSLVQQLQGDVLAADLKVFDVDDVRHSERWGTRPFSLADVIEPEVIVPVYVREGGNVGLSIRTEDDDLLYERNESITPGLSSISYDLSVTQEGATSYERAHRRQDEEERPYADAAEDNGLRYLRPGTYRVVVTQGEVSDETKLEITNGGRR